MKQNQRPNRKEVSSEIIRKASERNKHCAFICSDDDVWEVSNNLQNEHVEKFRPDSQHQS